MNPVVDEVTQRIVTRSRESRTRYLAKLESQADSGRLRSGLSCSNLAHGMAACSAADKDLLTEDVVPNIAIVSAYNDMLSAHQPY